MQGARARQIHARVPVRPLPFWTMLACEQSAPACHVSSCADQGALGCSTLEAAVRWASVLQKELLDVAWPEAILEWPECAERWHQWPDGHETLLWKGLRVRVGMASGRPQYRKPLNTGNLATPSPELAPCRPFWVHACIRSCCCLLVLLGSVQGCPCVGGPPLEGAGGHCPGRADYYGSLPNLAARVAALAHPGQILIEATSGFREDVRWLPDDQVAVLSLASGPSGTSLELEDIELQLLGFYLLKVRCPVRPVVPATTRCSPHHSLQPTHVMREGELSVH